MPLMPRPIIGARLLCLFVTILVRGEFLWLRGGEPGSRSLLQYTCKHLNIEYHRINVSWTRKYLSKESFVVLAAVLRSTKDHFIAKRPASIPGGLYSFHHLRTVSESGIGLYRMEIEHLWYVRGTSTLIIPLLYFCSTLDGDGGSSKLLESTSSSTIRSPSICTFRV